MAVTKHTRISPPAARFGAANAAGADSAAIRSLLRQAEAFVLRAPELAVVCAERAASLAEAAGSDELWVRAEALAVSGRVRLGLRADTVGRAVAALRAAEELDDPSVSAGLRTDLALCARSVGVPLMGLAAVRPVLAIDGLTGAGRAAALSQLVGCLSQFGRKPELDRTLAEADKLCGADESLDGDDRLLGRALVRVAMSAHRRRHADVLGAGDAARTGLGLLEQLDDPSCDGGFVRVRLILHLVCSLLDRGDTENARDIAETLLAEPARAASVAPLGWLRMAVATRILLPAGAVEAAGVMLRDAVHSTERHGLHSLNARLWAELAHVEERLGRASEAIDCLHRSRAAEHVHTRSRRQATGLLTGEFGQGGHAAVDLDEILGRAGTTEVAEAARAPETVVAEGKRSAASAGRPAVELIEAAQSSGQRRATPVASPAHAPAASAGSRTSVPEAPAPRAKPVREKAERVSTDEPPLAPPPADAPAERPQPVVARESAAPVEALSGAASESEGSAEDKPKRKTRHDSEHGSVAARSVLDRLGISPGARGGGGRRRAADESDPATTPRVNGTNGHSHSATGTATTDATTNGRRRARTDDVEERGVKETQTETAASTVEHGAADSKTLSQVETTSAKPEPEPAQEAAAEGKTADVRATSIDDILSPSRGAQTGTADAETAEAATAKAEKTEPGSADTEAAASKTSEPETATSSAEPESERPLVNDPWLPRLRLPPSLEPFEGFGESAEPAASETRFTSTPVISDDLGDSFPREYADAPPLDEELPADAGLADLLARALAEHQAGTTSAAALVKRLGNQGSEDRSTVNGHNHANGDTPNGRHRGGRDH